MLGTTPMTRGLVALLISVIGWGLAPVATQLALHDLTAATVLALRFSIVVMLLVPLVLRPAPPLDLRAWTRLSAAALLGVVGYNVAITYGLRETSASTAGFLIAAEPVLILIFARLSRRETVARRCWAGAMVSTVGVTLVAALHPTDLPGSSNGLAGPLLVLLAASCFSVYVVLLRPLALSHGALRVTTVTTLMGSLVIVTVTLPTADLATVAGIAPGALLAIIGLALGSTVLAMVLYNHSSAVLGSGRAGVGLNLIPLVTALGSLVILDQTIPAVTLAAGAIILLGVAIASPSPANGKV